MDAFSKKLVRQLRKVRSFPTNTCPYSRHAQMIGENLIRSKPYPMLQEEPEHCGGSILATVLALYMVRDEVAVARQNALEEAAAKLSEWYPDNVSTNAFCAAIRSLKNSDETGSPVHQKTTRDPAASRLQQGLATTTTTGTVGNANAAKVRDGGNVAKPEKQPAQGPLPASPVSSDACLLPSQGRE